MARPGSPSPAVQRGRGLCVLFRSLVGIAIRRFRQNTRLSLTLLVGAVFATGLAAATPIYLDAIRDLGLGNMVAEAAPGSLDLTYEQSGVQTTVDSVTGLETALDAEVSAAAGSLTEEGVRVLQTSTFVFRRPDEPFSDTGAGVKGFFAWHSHFGAFTHDAPELPAWDGSGPLPVVLLAELAERLGVSVGDEFFAQPFWLPQQREVPVVVVGLASLTPERADDPSARLIARGPAGTESQLRLWIARDAIVRALPAAAPQLRSILTVRYPTRVGDLDGDEAARLEKRLAVLATRIEQQLPDMRQISGLPALLRDFDERFTFAEGTLLLVALQLIGALLLYLVITSAMVAAERTGDVAWLRSRGATRSQTVGLQLIEAALITIPAVALGPLVGLGLVSLLGLVPPFDAFADGPFITPRLSALAWILSALTGVLALGAQFIPTYVASRESVVTERRLRGRHAPSGVQRLAVDVAAIGVAAVLIYQLERDPAPIDSPVVGETSIDFLTAATPAVLVFVVGLAVLRLLPVALRAAARLGVRGLPAAPVLGMLYLSRAPTHYGRMVVLLLVTGSLAVFAASFDTTLDRSYDERSQYAVGADLRIVEPLANELNAAQLQRDVADPPAAATVVTVERFGGRLAGERSLGVDLMTTDAPALAATAFFRGDFAPAPLEESLAGLAPPPREPPFAIDDIGGRLFLWTRPLEARPGVAVVARMRDGDGRFWDYVLGFMDDARAQDDPARRTQPDDPQAYRLRNGRGDTLAVGDELDGWLRLEQSVFQPNFLVTVGGLQPVSLVSFRPRAPLTLSSVGVRIAGRQPFTQGTLLFDALGWDYGGEERVLASFEDPSRWTLTPLRDDGTADALVASADAVDGGTALEFSWQGDAADRLRGFRPAVAEEPLAAVVSEELLDRAGTSVGGTLVVTIANLDLEFRVAAAFDLFPTFDPAAGAALVITDRAGLEERVMQASTIGLSRGAERELWIATDSVNAVVEELGAAADHDSLVIAAVERDAIAVDPLVAAGWNGIFAGAMVAVAAAVGFGLITLTLTMARARRVEFALLRSLGLSAGQLTRVVALELMVVVVAGLGLGLLLGVLAGGVFLDFFAVTPEGGDVLPPLVYEVHWRAVGLVFAALGGFLALNIGLALLILRRTDIQAQLRLGL